MLLLFQIGILFKLPLMLHRVLHTLIFLVGLLSAGHKAVGRNQHECQKKGVACSAQVSSCGRTNEKQMWSCK